jgi:hypothetical protein
MSADNKTFRVAHSTVLIGMVVFSPFLLEPVLCIFNAAQPSTALLMSAIYLVGLYALCSPEVILQDHMLTYRNIFGSRSVDLPSIERVRVVADPAPRLELKTKGSGAHFTFIIKPFSKAGVTQIMNRIHTEAPAAHFDTVSSDLMRGDFVSVTHEAMSVKNLIRIALTLGSGMFAADLVRALWR